MTKKTCIAVLSMMIAVMFAACGGGGSSSGDGGGGGGSNDLPPVVTMGSGTSTSYDNATLTGTVNPNGFETSVWIEYGTDNTLADNTATTAASKGAGATPVNISENLTGLAGSTRYYYTIVAQSAIGTTRGTITSFLTLDRPPTVETRGADIDSHTEATLNGIVNPHGFATTAWFEFGESSTLADKTTYPLASPGSGNSNVTVSQPLTGLTAGRTYYFALVAESSAGRVRGKIKPFTMPASGFPLPDAGTDQNVFMRGGAGATVVTLAASGTDPGGSIASYAWSQIAGEAVTLTGAGTDVKTFTAPALTYNEIKKDLVFEVAVTDNDGNVSTDNVTVTVNWGYSDDFLADTLASYTTGGTGAVTWSGDKIQVANGASGVDSFFSRLFGFGAGQTSKNGKFSITFHPTVIYSGGGIVLTLHESNNAVRYRMSTVDDANFDKILEKRWNSTDNGAVTLPFNPTVTAGQDYTITVTYDDDDVTFSAFEQTYTLSNEDTGAVPIWFTVNVIGVDGTFDDIKLERKP